jgi:hypothetical protein
LNEQEADQEARRRNLELGERGVTDRYSISVQVAPGQWVVDERQEAPSQPEKQGWRSRVIDWVLGALPWLP